MTRKRDMEQLFSDVIGEFNEQMDEDTHLKMEQEEKLFGTNGKLDSIGLVNFIVLLEEHIEDFFGLEVVIADEKAMSRKASPFLTIGSLMEHIGELLEENLNG